MIRHLFINKRHIWNILIRTTWALNALQMHLVLYLFDQLRLNLINDLHLLGVTQIIDIVQLQIRHLILHHGLQLVFHLFLNVLFQEFFYMVLVGAVLRVVVWNHVDEFVVRLCADIALIDFLIIIWNRHELSPLTGVDWRSWIVFFDVNVFKFRVATE